MSIVELEAKEQKVFEDPRISLTMVGRLVVASERCQQAIIKKCKYPSKFIPGYYEQARKVICETFAGNFKGDYALYFDEFKRKAKEFREAAKPYAPKQVLYRNNMYSAESLDGIIAIKGLLTPLFDEYIFHSNLAQNKSALMMNSIRIGAMADMLLYDQYGLNHIGFIKYNFSKTKFSAAEAAIKLHVLKKYYEFNKMNLNPKDCLLIDVATRRIFSLADVSDANKALDKACRLIKDSWELI